MPGGDRRASAEPDAIRGQLAADVMAERARAEAAEADARTLRADVLRLRAELDAERAANGRPVRRRWVGP